MRSARRLAARNPAGPPRSCAANVMSLSCSASTTAVTASVARESVAADSERLLSPAPGASSATQRKSFCRRAITSRHTKLHEPTWTNNNVGPWPTSVTAMRPVSCSSAYVGHGHADAGSQVGLSMRGRVCMTMPFNQRAASCRRMNCWIPRSLKKDRSAARNRGRSIGAAWPNVMNCGATAW